LLSGVRPDLSKEGITGVRKSVPESVVHRHQFLYERRSKDLQPDGDSNTISTK
jgi:hypothetical protein